MLIIRFILDKILKLFPYYSRCKVISSRKQSGFLTHPV